jgi:hypothetical protein
MYMRDLQPDAPYARGFTLGSKGRAYVPKNRLVKRSM